MPVNTIKEFKKNLFQRVEFPLDTAFLVIVIPGSVVGRERSNWLMPT